MGIKHWPATGRRLGVFPPPAARDARRVGHPAPEFSGTPERAMGPTECPAWAVLVPARRARMVPALALLWEAREDAQCFGRDVWDFALRLSDLSAVGLPPTDVRWLLVNRLVEHRIESTRSGDAARVFEPSANLALADRSCFVATGLAGAVAAPAVPPVAGRGCGAGDPAGRAVPLWDAASRQLLSGGRVVKRFPRPAPFQELLLAAFEEDGWPDRIDDPLPRTGGRDPDERLHDTVRRLNGHQVNRLIAFVRDGTGEGVCWRPRAARRAPTQRPRSAPGNASPPVRK